MRMFSFVPDKWMVQIQYRLKTGRKLNLKDPKRYTEKLQWYKLYYRNPLMPICVDKYKVRQYVKNRGYGYILNSLIGVYDSLDEINFKDLPDQFVIKDTLGGGGNSVIICRDKKKLDIDAVKNSIRQWLEPTKGKHPGREWFYDNGTNRIIIEAYIDSDASSGGLIDYKFFCFDSKVAYVYGIADRVPGQKVGLGIFDENFKLLPYERADEKPLSRVLKKPENYDEMIRCAEKLSCGFPHARIDLYDQNNKILFGEITFCDGSGYMTFKPDKFDYLMGEAFKLPEKI